MEQIESNIALEGTVADNNNEEKIFLSSIEEHIAQDKDGRFREQVLGMLYTEAVRLKQLKDQGASPDEFARIESVLTALVAAIEVVDKGWQQHHKKKS